MKDNDIVRITQYLKVKNVGNANVLVDDLNRGIKDISIRGDELIHSLDSADDFKDTKKVTRTELAKIFGEVKDNVFTVVFTKKNGEERTLRGYMVERETGMGRSKVIDLDVERGDKYDYDHRLRQVDHRTLESLVVDGVKYVKK